MIDPAPLRPGPRAVAAVLTRPRPAFARLTAHPAPAVGLGAGALLGVSWALLAAWLAAGGHAPSMTRGLPVDAERYYATAALYLAPLWIALTALTAGAAHGAARLLGGRGDLRATLGAVGAAYALPLWVAVVIPDAIVYGLAGFDAMGVAMRVQGPIAVVWVTTLTTLALRATQGLGTGRALVAALCAAVAQAAPAALLVR